MEAWVNYAVGMSNYRAVKIHLLRKVHIAVLIQTNVLLGIRRAVMRDNLKCALTTQTCTRH